MNYPFTFRWTKKHENFCISKNIFLDSIFRIKNVYKKRNLLLLRPGKKITLTCDIFAEPYATMPHKSFCSIGAYSYSSSAFPNEMSIGRFCSIASKVTIMGTMHPTDRFTTSPLTYNKEFSKILKLENENDIHEFNENLPLPTIGHDVWIGENVVLKGGITIGHGAIVGANAVVTKDVPPYAVVIGVPAKVIRFRFNNDIIEKLLSLTWWEYQYTDIPFRHLHNIKDFILSLESKIENKEIHKKNHTKINLSDEFINL